MRLKSLAAIAALSLIAAPVAAAAPSPRRSRSRPARRREHSATPAELEGTTAWILAAIALGLIVWGIIELTGDGTNTCRSALARRGGQSRSAVEIMSVARSAARMRIRCGRSCTSMSKWKV